MKSHNSIHKLIGRSLLLVTLLSLGLDLMGPKSLAAAAPLTPEALEAFFDAELTRQMADEGLVGATVAVVQGDAQVFAKGYGYADLAAGTSVDVDRTLFYIGSDGKLFTWTAVMQLAEQGRLDLRADVNSYLDFEIPTTFPEPITLHHLMTHTAGFEEQLAALFVGNEADLLPLRDFLVRHRPARVYAPGAIYAYSNYGTALAGYIVARVSGQSYEDYITAHLLAPLGMARSAAVQPLPPELGPDMSVGYQVRDDAYDTLDFEWVAAAPCAPIRATAPDIGRFMRAHLNGGCVDGVCILQPETLQEMHRLQFAHHPSLFGSSYGFVASRFNGQRVLWHMGESARFVTALALLPESDIGLLVSYNTPPVDGTAILFRFLDAFYPIERPTPQPATLPDRTARADAVSGTYVSSRAAHTSPQKLITWLGTLPVMATAAEELAVGTRRYVETEPGLFQQRDGDRALTFREDAGRTWLFEGSLAYFKLRWYEQPLLHLGLFAVSLLLFASGWIAWPLAAVRHRRRGEGVAGEVRSARWTAAGLGLLMTGLLAAFVVRMLAFGTTYVYPTAAVALITRLLWVTVPLTIAVVVFAARAWRRREFACAWRLHYSLIALAAVALTCSLWLWRLLAI